MVLHAPLAPALAPFVAVLWASEAAADEVAAARPIVTRERILPSGLAHLAFRLHGPPVVLYRGPEDLVGTSYGHAVVGGPRAEPYLRDAVTPAISVGAQLRAGAVEQIFGVPAESLTGRHVPLQDLWGRDADHLLEQLTRTRAASDRLELLARTLERRVLAAEQRDARAPPPSAVRQALETLDRSADVAIGALARGVTPRHFTDLFARSVGLTPKRFARVRRFQGALARLLTTPAPSFAALALEAGYSDQAHFTREFVAFTGVSPSQYRALAPAQRGHLPLSPVAAPGASSFRISSRHDDRRAASSGT